MVFLPSTNQARRCLTFEIRQDGACSGLYGHRQTYVQQALESYLSHPPQVFEWTSSSYLAWHFACDKYQFLSCYVLTLIICINASFQHDITLKCDQETETWRFCKWSYWGLEVARGLIFSCLHNSTVWLFTFFYKNDWLLHKTWEVKFWFWWN